MNIYRELIETLKEHTKAMNRHSDALEVVAQYQEQERLDEIKRYSELER